MKLSKSKIYLCDCKNYDTNNATMHPTKVNNNGQCIDCEHYAFYGEYKPKDYDQKYFQYSKEDYEKARLLFVELGNILEVSRELGIGKGTLYKWKKANGWKSPKYNKQYSSEFINRVKFYYQHNNFNAKKTAEFFDIKIDRVKHWSLFKKWKGKKHRTKQEKMVILNRIKRNSDFKKQADKENVTERTLRNWYKILIGKVEYKTIQRTS